MKNNKSYSIKPLVWSVKDESSVRFHVDNDDYFGTIATVLSLIKQQIKRGECDNAPLIEKTLKNLEKDLLFLQQNYQINPKTKNKNKTPKGNDNNQ